MAKHTTCRYCSLDIEGVWPYRKGEWRDRGNNTHCNDMLKFEEGDLAHAPVVKDQPSRVSRAQHMLATAEMRRLDRIIRASR